jgi:hypothetical protein
VIERRAFWPLLFADPSQQPVVARPPYADIAQPLGMPPAWLSLAEDPTRAAQLGSPYLADWRRRFDYVLVLGPPPSRESTPPGLRLVRAGLEASLYSIER